MAVIRVKSEATEEENLQFLYNCPCDSNIANIAEAILEIYNLQAWIRALCLHLKQHLLTDSFRETYPAAAIALDRTLSEAESYASKEQVLHQRFLSPHSLRDHIQNIEEKVKFAHSWISPESNSRLTTFSNSFHTFDPELHGDVQLIWAGKELSKKKRLCEYIGDNEKTMIIIKLKLNSVDMENRMESHVLRGNCTN